MRHRLQVEGLREAMARADAMGTRARRPERALRSPHTLLDLQMSERRKFARGGWRRDKPAWIERKRRSGLDTRTMRATGRLESALTNATHGVKATVYNGSLLWGIRRGQSDVYYAAALAKASSSRPARRAVVVDRTARGRIAMRVGYYITDGTVV